MIKPNKDNNGEEAEIEPQDFLKAFYILLRSATTDGIYSFPAVLLDEIKDDEKLLEVVYSEGDDRIYIKTIKKRKRGVLRPKRKLILPE